MTRFSPPYPRHCALNAVSAFLTEGASLRQLSKIRDLFNTFSKRGTKFKFSYEIRDQWNNLTYIKFLLMCNVM